MDKCIEDAFRSTERNVLLKGSDASGAGWVQMAAVRLP